MPSSKDFGLRFAHFVADYLKEKGFASLGAINRLVLADLSQRFMESEKKGRAVGKGLGKGLPQTNGGQTEDDWLASLQALPCYMGLSVAREIEKCRAWSQVNRKAPSRRRIINWLNRATENLPIQTKTNGSNQPSGAGRLYAVPVGAWLEWRKRIFPDVEFESDEWNAQTLTVKQEILKRMGL